MDKLKNNSEYKEVSQGILIVLAAALLINIIFISVSFEIMESRIAKRDLIMLGSVVDKYPGSENLIMKCINNKGNEINFEYGKIVASRYGNIDETNIGIIPYVKNIYRKQNLFIFFSSLICIMLASFILKSNFNSIYKRIDNMSIAADKIMEGDFSHRIFEEGEGAISKLSHQFDQMARRLEYTIEQLNSEKEYLRDITSDISHQLKTPLTSIKMFNEFLIDGVEEKNKDNFLKEMYYQIEKMEWLINAILKASRLKSGVIQFNFKSSNLCKTVNTAIASLKDNYTEKNQNIIFNMQECKIMLYHDEAWLSEAIKNVLENAIEYSRSGSDIFVILTDMESHIKLEIKDSGIGISPEELPNIFKRFYRGKNNEEINKKGTGIGLFLTKLIVERHQGRIEAASERGKGTTFTLTFLKQNI